MTFYNLSNYQAKVHFYNNNLSKTRLEIVIHSHRSNPFDNKKDDICIDSLKNKLHLSLNTDNQDHDQCNKDKSPSSVKEVKDIILASSKSILGKVLSPTKEKYLSREKVRRNYTDWVRVNFDRCDYSRELSRQTSRIISDGICAQIFFRCEEMKYQFTAEQVSAKSATSAATSDTYDTPTINRSVRLRWRRGEHTDNRRQMVAIDLTYQIAKSGPWCQYIRDCADCRFLCISSIISSRCINNKSITRTVTFSFCCFFPFGELYQNALSQGLFFYFLFIISEQIALCDGITPI